MCGIVGLFLKDKALAPELGRLFAPMLQAMDDRGPDSAGFAVYRDGLPAGTHKLTLYHPDETFSWATLAGRLEGTFGFDLRFEVRASHAVFMVKTRANRIEDGEETQLRQWFDDEFPGVRIMSIGQAIEIYKEKGRPVEVARRFALGDFHGSHAIGHTRMATESAVTTEHSHPFSTGVDLCLVHNGSFSNHNRLRLRLKQEGVPFQTDNDTEVAAGYLAHRLKSGESLETVLESALTEFDGFYTLAIGTRNGFAVLRDPIACKPAVIAETDAWVAMASEYYAMAHLPSSDTARIWEPEPAKVYSWSID